MEKNWEMPKEFGEKWITALRSGDYVQAEGELYNVDNDGYCCLGVACSMEGIDNHLLSNAELITDVSYMEEDVINIPDILIQDVDDNNLVEVLTDFNDGVTLTKLDRIIEQYSNLKFRKELKSEEGKTKVYFSFNEIADFIEDNIEMI